MTDPTTCTSSSTDGAVDSSRSYRSVLKATSILGSAAAVNVLISMLRSKVVAEFLGKSGLGEMGLYMSLSGLAVSLASFGLNISGVRELADRVGEGDDAKIKSSRLTLKKLSWGLGLLGTLVMAAAAYPISVKTFGTSDHVAGVAWLSVIVVLSLLSNYWMALVQVSGQMNRVGKIQVCCAVVGACVSAACFVLLREKGIIPALILGAVVQMLAAAYWSRGISLPMPDAETRYSPEAARRLLTFGGISVAVGVQASVVGLLIRKLVLDSSGMDGVGVFQAAQGLSAIFATYILNSMGADFLPRLTSAMRNRAEANRMINDQTAIALLLGLPGVIGTIVFAPWVTTFFYSSQFGEAAPLLQVMTVGVFGRLLAWPLGMALMALDAKREWVLGEVVCSTVQVGVVWALLPSLGMIAVSLSAIAVSVVCSLLYYSWIRRLSGLRWSSEVYSALGIGCCLMLLVLSLAYFLPELQAVLAGSVIFLGAGWYSLQKLAAAAEVTRSGLMNRLLSIRNSLSRRSRSKGGCKD